MLIGQGISVGGGGDSEDTSGLAASNAACILFSQKSKFDSIAYGNCTVDNL